MEGAHTSVGACTWGRNPFFPVPLFVVGFVLKLDSVPPVCGLARPRFQRFIEFLSVAFVWLLKLILRQLLPI